MKMKKRYFCAFAMLPAALLASCDDTQEGTAPGGDSRPNVILYQYSPDEGYDADNTAKFRMAVNNATESVYLLSESAADYESHYSGDAEAYAGYVVDNGEETKISSSLDIDAHVVALGQVYVTAVAVRGGERAMSQTVSFYGKNYGQVSGTDDFVYTNLFGNVSSSKLYVEADDATDYVLKGVACPRLGDGEINLYLTVMTDASGNAVGGDGYKNVRVLPQQTPWTYGDYGSVFIRDIASWQGDLAYATEPGYDCRLYDDGRLQLVLQYYVSAGSLTWGDETFAPAE